MIPSALFFLKIALPIHGLLWFHTNFRIIYSVSVKNAMDILIRIEFVCCFGWYVHFNNIHEHGTSFHLFMLFSISFINVIYFSEYRSFTSLVRFICRHFTIFDAIVNQIDFIISLSDSSLLVYINVIYFCVLIFFPINILNSFISSRASLVSQMVKCLPAVQETQVQSLGWEDSPGEGNAAHFSTLA